MTVVCAWCGCLLRGDPTEKENISHGMCRECEERVMEEITRFEEDERVQYQNKD